MVEREETSKLKVWDLFVRSAHWSLGALVLGSFLTSEKDRLVHLHAKIGLTIGVLVLARAVWGLVGPHRPGSARSCVGRAR